MFLDAYRKAFNVIMKKPVVLWGLSLLFALISVLSFILTLPILALGFAAQFVLSAGMAKIYLDAIKGKTVNSDQLFAGFKTFGKVAGGMAWQTLWTFIWAIIPSVLLCISNLTNPALSWRPSASQVIVYIFITLLAIAAEVVLFVKTYSYAYVPYILMDRDDVNATQALRLSMQITNGRKLQMFIADLVFGIAVFVVFLVLFVFAQIPYIGALFMLVLVLFAIAVCVFGGLFTGLYKAYFYADAVSSSEEKTFDEELAPIESTDETPESNESAE